MGEIFHDAPQFMQTSVGNFHYAIQCVHEFPKKPSHSLKSLAMIQFNSISDTQSGENISKRISSKQVFKLNAFDMNRVANDQKLCSFVQRCRLESVRWV